MDLGALDAIGKREQLVDVGEVGEVGFAIRCEAVGLGVPEGLGPSQQNHRKLREHRECHGVGVRLWPYRREDPYVGLLALHQRVELGN